MNTKKPNVHRNLLDMPCPENECVRCNPGLVYGTDDAHSYSDEDSLPSMYDYQTYQETETEENHEDSLEEKEA